MGLTYNAGLDGHIADLATKSEPQGRKWVFGYDDHGNLISVTDPKGSDDPTKGDYTTRYTTTGTANGQGHRRQRPLYRLRRLRPSGYPRTTTDPFGCRPPLPSTTMHGQRSSRPPTAQGAHQHHGYDLYGTAARQPGTPRTRRRTSTSPPRRPSTTLTTTSSGRRPRTAPCRRRRTTPWTRSSRRSRPGLAERDPPRRTTYTYDNTGHLLTTTEPKGIATTSEPDDYVTQNRYDEINQLTSTVNALGDRIPTSTTTSGNKITVVDPKKNMTSDPNDFSAKNTYDLEHRVTRSPTRSARRRNALTTRTRSSSPQRS